MIVEIKVPALGESISEVEIGQWLKQPGENVGPDENLVLLESEKATVELPAPGAGVLKEVLKKKGEPAKIGEIIARFDSNGKDGSGTTASKPAPESKTKQAEPAPPRKAEARVMPSARRVLEEAKVQPGEVPGTGPGGRILKEDAMKAVEGKTMPPAPPRASGESGREEQVVPMTRLRKTLTRRLQEAQQEALLLTTFNEIDLSAVMALRKELGEAFLGRHKTKLGFMSFFVKAVIDALQNIPELNAEVRGEQIVYRNYYDIGVAIGGGKGLVVPVLKNAHQLTFAGIELAIADFAARAKSNTLKLEELQGGTFTITNGGVYGSLLSTPLINPPQSGILGMHAIQERPVAREGQVVIRPMMYVALTYDHRIVDGREAVTFLKRIKDTVETPSRLLLDI